jgi:hypothetical protein
MDLDMLKKLPREVQVVLGGTALYIIFSFFDWQSYSYGPVSVGENEWHGLGVLCVLIAIVLLAWEITRLLNMNINLPLTPGQVSAGLALLLALFTVITFLDWSQIRAWPEWLGLILSLAIGGAAVVRAKGEGVTMPEMPKNISVGGSGGGSMSAPPPPPPPPPPASDNAPPASDSSDA